MVSVFDQTELRLPKPNYDYITNEDGARKAMSFLANYPTHSIDTETTALDMYEAKISLIQIGVNDKVFVFDVRHETEHSSLHKDVLKPILTSNDHKRILQNALFDMKMIYRHMGFYLSNIYDTMLVEQLLNLGLPGVKVNLPALLLRYLGITMQKEPRLTFQDYNQKFQNFQLEYAANDVVALETIKDLQWSKVQQEGLENVCRLEFEFLVPMAEMEGNGILLDVDRWSSIMVEVKKEMIETGNAVKSILEENQDQSTLFGVSTINIDSNLQLKKALNRYGLNMDNTSVDTLKKHKGVPVIDALLDYRSAQKLISTYSDSLIEKINPHTGRLHTDFKQLVATGRMSSARPNLQNIPKKQKFRSCFIAKEDYSLVTSDMASCELRILGNLSEDPVFLDCFENNIDLHTRTASEIFDVHLDKVTHDMRGIAKNINFGLCVLEDTKVITDKGIKEIKNVNIGEKISHDLGVNEIIDKKFMGEKEVFEIKTKYGYTLEATSDHLIKVIDENGNYIDKKLSNTDINKDYMCIKLGSDLFPKNNYKFDKFSIKRKTIYKHFELPNTLDEDWATFLGLYVSEGHLHKSRCGHYDGIHFGISSEEKDFVNVFDSLLNKLFKKFGKRKRKKENIIVYTINSVLIAEWIKSLFICDFKNKTSTIEVPECVKQSPKKIQAAFIKALFEGDGTIFHRVNYYRVGYYSKSINLMTDLQIILLNFGILSTLYLVSDKRYPNENYYILRIISKYNHLFMEDIGFLTNHKNNKKIDNRLFIRSCFVFPYQKRRLLRIENKLRAIKYKTIKNWNNIRYLHRRINSTSIKGLGNFYLDQFAEYDPFFKFIYDNNIVPLPIKSIKSKGIKKVYDISVDEHQYFLANGFIVHNCYGISPVGLARSLKISKKEAKRMIDKYFERYSGVERYLEKAGKGAILNRYTTTISGRKRYYNLPEYDHPDRKKIQRSIERKGKNANIQGASSDTIKEAMVLLVDRLVKGGYDAKLLLTVHDEVVVEVKEDQKYEVGKIVSQCLIDGFGRYFSLIPMEADSLIGPCWLKSSCENKINGVECGNTEMRFVPDDRYGTKLICNKCGAGQE